MPAKPVFPARVFYDGSCSVCATEIEHYLRRDHQGKLLPVDISSPDFDPEPLRITLDVFMYELHVIDCAGNVFKGVEAFWAIWQALSTSRFYSIIGAIINMPLVNQVARLFYKGFARIRKYLPKRHSCSSGTCRIDKHKTDRINNRERM